MNTHDTILSTALQLFSQKGYADASIRDICKLVGIKESSLYFHFRNKQAILDELTERFVTQYSAALNSFADSVRRMNYLTPGIFTNIIDRYLTGCFLDEEARRFLCILLHEHGQNPALQKVFLKWFYEEPLEILKEMFMILIDVGFIRRCSVSFLAESFLSPAAALFLKHLTTEVPDTKNFLEEYHDYLERFLKEFRA